MEKQNSAIDTIYKISEELDSIKQYLQLIDNAQKLILNNQNKQKKEIDEIKQILAEQNTKPTLANVMASSKPSDRKQKKESSQLVIGAVKTFGYIKNKEKSPLKDIEINIFNDKDEIIKRRKTDDNGYWDVRLPPGKYGVEYIQKGYKPVNISINIEKGMREFEVK